MKTINTNIFPKGGHWFTEKDGTTIQGDTWLRVIAAVRLYRQRNGLPEGDPETEIVEQVCARNPGICVETFEPAPRFPDIQILKTKVLAWLHQLREWKNSGNLMFVDTPAAQARTFACVSCPFNRVLPEGCASCNMVIDELRRDTLQHRPRDSRLNACLLLGEDVQTSIWLDLISVPNPALPGHCWRKRTI